ncbi:MAG: hypothetical protein ACI9ON_001805 [Limisphaerales bacterium]|jgi:hypothetical protein
MHKLIIGFLFFLCSIPYAFAEQQNTTTDDGHCPYHQSDAKQVYWGDLHVHTGYSLDAWGYGTSATPADAYAFAKGKPIDLADGRSVALDRPLDFMAVTDHAEWFNLLYVCTDPQWSESSYCNTMTEKNNPAEGSQVFGEYVIPTITKASPAPTPLCAEDKKGCRQAMDHQWGRIQQQTHEANDPCSFTSFAAFEWSATPEFSHNHRNVIFANENVTPRALDYLTYSTPQKLWQEIDRQCKQSDGCEAIVIPHNTNMGDGKSFDVESESTDVLSLRARFERLVEIHQEKGNSECLPAFNSSDEDCHFERYLTLNSVPTAEDKFSQAQWEKLRSGYVRGLLLRGLSAYEASGKAQVNPLQLGIIGSTDNHAAAGGFVEEDQWPGSVFGLGDFDRSMTRVAFNPGGLVAVWAEENTRKSIFAALQRREVYATSGPRIRARLFADDAPLNCNAPTGVVMGSELPANTTSPHFLIQAQYDRTPLQRIELIKGELVDGVATESVHQVWEDAKGGLDVCVTWQDKTFNPASPTFWYVRVLESPTPRWSEHRCLEEGRCDDFPEARKTIRERAWTSPVWFLPE